MADVVLVAVGTLVGYDFKHGVDLSRKAAVATLSHHRSNLARIALAYVRRYKVVILVRIGKFKAAALLDDALPAHE